eukprot:1015005-Pelagomonas_calceolata.AAC.4
MDVNIVKEDPQKGKDYSKIDDGDVVIFPAFGVAANDMKFFRDKGVNIVDTTCPWVAKVECGRGPELLYFVRFWDHGEASDKTSCPHARAGFVSNTFKDCTMLQKGQTTAAREQRYPWPVQVWNSVDTYAKKQCTSIIHGKYSHEETVATASFAQDYLIIKDLNEAQYVCDYIMKGGDREEFMKKFSKATSKGFDPDTMLNRVGLANQTTMLKVSTLGRVHLHHLSGRARTMLRHPLCAFCCLVVSCSPCAL